MEKSCPKCKADLPEEPGKICPVCKSRLPSAANARFVTVFLANDILQAQLVKSMLEGSRIGAWIQAEGTHKTWGGIDFWENKSGVGIQVAEMEEEMARKVLCLRGVVCQVTPGEVDSLMIDHVLPAASAGADAAKGLVGVLALNKKEVVAAVVHRLHESGEVGTRFLEAVLVEACRSGETRLTGSLAQALDEAGSPVLPSRLTELVGEDGRVGAAWAIAHMKKHRTEAMGALIFLLDDPDAEVRSEAIEGLFSLEGKDFGFEPDAPPEKRAAAVERWRVYHERLGGTGG